MRLALRQPARAPRYACLIVAGALGIGEADAQPGPDPRDARIDALEAQVRVLTRMVEKLSARNAAAAAPAIASPDSAHSASGTAAGSGSAGRDAAVDTGALSEGGDTPDFANPPSRSPDQTRPVQSSEPGPNQGFVTFAGAHPSLHSADGRFVATLHGVLHLDAGGYFQRAAGPVAVDLRRGGSANDTAHARNLGNGSVLRRARIGIDGQLFRDFEYNVLFDFGGAGAEDAGHVFELWMQYSGLKPFHLRVGAFAPSFGLEDQNSVQGMPLLERPAITDLARGTAAGDFREAVQLSAGRDRWFAAAALTTHTVSAINTSSVGSGANFDQSFGGVARLAAIPLQGRDWLIHTGVHASRVFSMADMGGPDASGARYPAQLRERPELRIDGTRLIDTGMIDARHVNVVGLELAAQKGSVYVQGEYEHITVERRDAALANPRFIGWYVEGGWLLTGERRKYNTGTFAFDGPPVTRPFDPKTGGFGAVELVGRFSRANLNFRHGSPGAATPAGGVRGGEQTIYAAGVNWYLNPIIRFMLDYQHVDVDRLSPDAATYLTPLGAQVGQSFDTVAVRSQLAF